MPDVVAAPAAAPAPATAPAAADSPAVASAPPVAASTTSAPGTDTGAPAGDTTVAPKTPADVPAPEPTEEPEAEEPEPFPAADTFGWDDWDGELDSLPGPVRAWADRLAKRYEKLSDEGTKAAREEAERLQAIWQSLIDGRPDPRMVELQKKLEEWEGKGKSHVEELARAKAEHEEYAKAVQAWHDTEATKRADAYRAQNGWMFDGGPVEKAADELLTQGFGLDDLPRLLRMPEKLLEMTLVKHRELKAKGMQDGAGPYAIQLAQVEFRFTPDTETSSVVDGASGRITAHPAKDAPTDAADLGSATLRVVRQNMNSRR